MSWLTHSFLIQHLSWGQGKLNKGSERGWPGVCSSSQRRARDWRDDAYGYILSDLKSWLKKKILNPPWLLVHFKMGFISLSLYLSVYSRIHLIQMISSFINYRIYNQVELASFHWREGTASVLRSFINLWTHIVYCCYSGAEKASLAVSH